MTTSIEHKGIATILAAHRLVVPRHQRSFGWTKHEVGTLLDDLDLAFARGREEYFLGSIVVIAEPNAERHQVLDGQQRLATVSLLLASIADAFESNGEGEAATEVRRLLMSYDIDSQSHTTHLRLNEGDDPYFRTLLRPGYSPPDAASLISHRLLHEAREGTRTWVRAKTTERRASIQWLKDTTRYLREFVRVIYFSVPDDSNAYLIFETLNDRGLELSIADLLKNYLLGRSGEDFNAVLDLWSRMLAALKAYGYEKNFTVFLRHYWSSKYEVAREKELYRRVKARVASAPNVLDFTTELYRASYYYTALLSPEHEFWTQADPKTRIRLRSLDDLGLEQYRPLLLAAMAHFELEQVEVILRMLEAWNVRLIIVGGIGGGSMEGQYATLGKGIRDGEIKNVLELLEKAREFVPGDIEFGSQFSVATVSKVVLARYYLNRLELVASGKPEPETVPSPALTLEHVLPERPGDNWPQFSEEARELYTRRIGNLALLTHRINSELKSAPFDTKVQVYAKSQLNLTRKIADTSEWTAGSIEERQRELASLALKAWPLSGAAL